jgi:class 3 adenylate cyclase/ActR/RegA family two-component response regulator
VTIRVVLGEDNVLVREGVRALLDSYEDVEVVGVAEDAPTLLRSAEAHTPDVVVTDIKMPPNFQLEGIDCAHAIREKHPGTGVVVLSAHDDEAYAIALLGKGQSGLAYLLKDRIAQGDELVRAIREVAAGGSAVDPTIAERLSGRHDTAEHDRQILDMMSQGLGYEQMATSLGTTQEAVDRTVTELFQRMAAQAEGGGAAAVDELKRLHAAVVRKEAAATAFRSFVPEQVAAKLQASGGTELREELEVTILFSDVRGYSTLAERLSPSQVAELVGHHLAAMSEVIIGEGGMVDQFVGDAIMAVFGAPEPIEDHAERAVRCALAMQARQRVLNREAGDGLPSIEMGIGINTGRVVAGTVGGAGRLEYTVVGDAVNVAARLQSEAGGGEIVASASTVAAGRAIAAEPIGARHVKGREEPVEVFRVLVDELEGAP